MSCIPRISRATIQGPVGSVPRWQVNMLCDQCSKPYGFMYTGTRAQVDSHVLRYLRCESCKQLTRGLDP
jgi:hypothetical protein